MPFFAGTRNYYYHDYYDYYYYHCFIITLSSSCLPSHNHAILSLGKCHRNLLWHSHRSTHTAAGNHWCINRKKTCMSWVIDLTFFCYLLLFHLGPLYLSLTPSSTSPLFVSRARMHATLPLLYMERFFCWLLFFLVVIFEIVEVQPSIPQILYPFRISSNDYIWKCAWCVGNNSDLQDIFLQ